MTRIQARKAHTRANVRKINVSDTLHYFEAIPRLQGGRFGGGDRRVTVHVSQTGQTQAQYFRYKIFSYMKIAAFDVHFRQTSFFWQVLVNENLSVS